MSYSKYYLYKKQYSNDSGTTWYDVTPLEQVPSGSPIATYDTLQECEGQTIPVTGVALNTYSLSVAPRGLYQLTATVLPANATNKSVIWSSSNSNIASVNSSGLVSGITTGNCQITVTTVDGGYSASCTVAVTTSTLICGMNINKSIQVYEGETATTFVDIYPPTVRLNPMQLNPYYRSNYFSIVDSYANDNRLNYVISGITAPGDEVGEAGTIIFNSGGISCSGTCGDCVGDTTIYVLPAPQNTDQLDNTNAT